MENPFVFTDCGNCKQNIFNVIKKSNNEQYYIFVNWCSTDEDHEAYMIHVNAMGDIAAHDFPTDREQLLDHLHQNFIHISKTEQCIPKFDVDDLCRDCGKPLDHDEESDLC